MKLICFALLLSLFSGCIKTAEQVQREKRIESMSEQMSDSQGLVSDLMNQLKEMQNQVDRMNGRLEELEHKNRKINAENMSRNDESMALIKAQQEAQHAQLVQIQNELKEQRSFIEKVTTTLSQNSSAATKPQKKNAKEELAAALELVKNNEYAKARNELEALIDHPQLSPGDHNRVLHGLGRVEFYTKNYEKSLVYFSKIYTKFPKASLAPNSLLFIARSLEKMGKKEESKQAYAKLIEDYPDSADAKIAKKES
jgi:TolA-binding protein